MNDVLYLSSLESKMFSGVRECVFIKKMFFDTGKECVIAKVDPPVVGQSFNLAEDISILAFSNRHEGDSLYPIKEFPCFVFIARLVDEMCMAKDYLTKEDLEILAWGELYETDYNARNHVF